MVQDFFAVLGVFWSRIGELTAELERERQAHTETRAKLAEVEARLAALFAPARGTAGSDTILDNPTTILPSASQSPR